MTTRRFRCVIAALAAVALMLTSTPTLAQAPLRCDTDLAARDDRCESWVVTYDHPGSHSFSGAYIEFTADAEFDRRNGRIFVTGPSYDPTTHLDWATVAFDAEDGDRLWVKRFDGGEEKSDSPHAIAVSPSGDRVFVVGSVNERDGLLDITRPSRAAVVAYRASDGRRLWTRRMTTSDLVDGSSFYLLEAAGSRVYLGGWGTRALTGRDFIVRTLGARSGRVDWTSYFDSGLRRADTPRAMGVDRTGGVYLAGTTESGAPGDFGWATAAVSKRGRTLWSRLRDGAATVDDDRATDLAVDPKGDRLYVAGHRKLRGNSNGYDAELVAYSTRTGRSLWTRDFRGPMNIGAPQLVEARAGQVVITTNVVLIDYRTAFDVAGFSRSGKKEWTGDRVEGRAESLEISPGGRRVYAVGRYKPAASQPQGRIDCVTAAYEPATDVTRWVARYQSVTSGPGSNCTEEHVTVMSSKTTAFVAATVQHQDLNGLPTVTGNVFDFLLFAYEPSEEGLPLPVPPKR